MVKVGLVGLKDDRELVLSLLHDLGIAQIEPLSKAALEYLTPERGSEQARTAADQFLRFRGLKNALPPKPTSGSRRFARLEAILAAAKEVPIDDEVGSLVREEDRLLTQRKSIVDQLDLLNRFDFYADRFDLLFDRNLFAFLGEADAEAFEELRKKVPQLGASQFLSHRTGDSVRFIVLVRNDQAEAASRLAQQAGVSLSAVPRLSGTRIEEIPRLEKERQAVGHRIAQIRTRLEEISRRWYPAVVEIEEALAIENRKLEIWTKLGAGERTFALEAWVPRRSRATLEQVLNEVTHGRTVAYDLPTREAAPTLMENPRGIRWFEFFIRFYSLPQSNEFDPTPVFSVVFTIFFGIMLGDWGYALVILLIAIWMIRGFPGRRYLPKSIKNFMKMIMAPPSMQKLAFALLPGCIVAIGFGIFFNEFFGFPVLTALTHGAYTGVDPKNATIVKRLLVLAGYIGLGMVIFGFVLGALKEYFHHNLRGSIARVGGIAFAIAIAWIGLTLIHSGNLNGLSPQKNPVLSVAYALAVAGPLMLVFGEGAQMGLMGLIEVVSHILSYTRLVGILLASVILALVINNISVGLVGSGSIGFIVAGLVILLIGQTFNVVVGVFEPGIQGARLIFVEYFSKFYSGNGKAFQPFGSRRKYTLPQYSLSGPRGGVPLSAPNRKSIEVAAPAVHAGSRGTTNAAVSSSTVTA
jgi:V/A-type H+-transporting ATPase subunit I